MFYTLGDYRDICIGGDRDIVGDTIVSNTEGSSSSKTKKISQIIEEMLSEQSGTTPPTPVTENSDEQRKKWWDENAKHIWHGMICALTYKENGAKGGTALEQIDEVKEKLFDTNKNTPIEKYQYNTVKLDDTSGDGRKTNEDTIQPATLKDFVERPPYFRYLEEWGENFCKERKKRLKQIYKECKVGQGNGKNGNKKCSGYGEDCEDQLEDEPTNVSDLKCPRCGRHCSSYTKWIQRKGKEFDEQKKAYVEQKDKCVNESNNHRNGFCGKLEENAAAFLQNLGSCKKDNGESNGNDHEEDEIKFDEKHKTFKQTEYCDPCSKFNINCKENGNCKRDTENKCNSKKGNDYITAKDIGNGGNSTHKLDMLVSDNSGNGFTGVLDECAGANIFKGIRKEEWECGNVCGYEVCIPQKGNSQKVKEKQNDEKHIITIRALVTHWVQNFLEDYNKIRHKISHCKENSEQTICKKDCKDKCKCVKKWISTKKQEWQQIKTRLLEQYKGQDYYNVKTILEDLRDRPVLNKAIKPCPSLNAFEKSCGLNGTDNSQNGNNNDLVLCMIKNLEKKIDECKNKQDETSVENGGKSCTPLDNTTLEELLEETEENTVGKQQPSFCNIEKKAEPVVESGCEPESTATPKEPATKGISEETNNEQVPDTESKTKAKEEVPQEPAGAPKKPPEQEKRQPIKPSPDDPWEPLKNAMLSSTIMWSIGIGFAAFTYFYLK
ncbi:hypothetical protein PFFVO_05891, partial [Plasmodium falciparum Vietnam Oak-Knoll (FVO)]